MTLQRMESHLKADNIYIQKLFSPPSCGALVLIAVMLPLILWLIPLKRQQQQTQVNTKSLTTNFSIHRIISVNYKFCQCDFNILGFGESLSWELDSFFAAFCEVSRSFSTRVQGHRKSYSEQIVQSTVAMEFKTTWITLT